MKTPNVSITIGKFKNVKALCSTILTNGHERPKAIIMLKDVARLKKSNGEVIANEVKTDQYINMGDNVVIEYQKNGINKRFTGIVTKRSSTDRFEIESEGEVSIV